MPLKVSFSPDNCEFTQQVVDNMERENTAIINEPFVTEMTYDFDPTQYSEINLAHENIRVALSCSKSVNKCLLKFDGQKEQVPQLALHFKQAFPNTVKNINFEFEAY